MSWDEQQTNTTGSLRSFNRTKGRRAGWEVSHALRGPQSDKMTARRVVRCEPKSRRLPAVKSTFQYSENGSGQCGGDRGRCSLPDRVPEARSVHHARHTFRSLSRRSLMDLAELTDREILCLFSDLMETIKKRGLVRGGQQSLCRLYPVFGGKCAWRSSNEPKYSWL
jgi:hypothetical protein